MRLETARKFALALPETTEEPHFEKSSFRVKGKIFATVPEGGKHLHVFVASDEAQALVAQDPVSYEEIVWGKQRKSDWIRVTLAVAGFRPADLDITAQQNLLTIQGRKREDLPEGEMVHVGIANRGFERRFELADFVRVANADLSDGLLVIDLVREVPEAMKPKKIAIGAQPTLEVVPNDRDEADAA